MPAALFAAFVLVPLAELYVIARVGQALGFPVTLGVLLLVSVLGAALVKREGVRTWLALRTSFGTGQMPTRALSDAALVLVGGVLLLTPGFLTDLAGLFLVLPPTRAVARRLLTAFAVRRALRPTGRRDRPSGPPRRGSGQIIEGQVLDHDTERDATEPRSR